jgi:uncharacterized protein DUF4349
MTSPETLELEAIDAALAGQWVAPEYDELADLALLLRDDRPEPTPAFTNRLDRRVADGFPARPRRRRQWLHNAFPVLAVAAIVAVIAIPLGFAISGSDVGGDDAGSVSSLGRDDSGGGGGGSAGGGSSGAGNASGTAESQASPVTPRETALTAGDRASRRKVQRSVDITLAAPRRDIDRVAAGVGDVAADLGGFVRHSRVTSSSGGNMQLRVPSNRLDIAVQRLSKLAKVRELSRTADDITGAVVSARDRLRDARAERESLLDQLAKATTVNETESIRARLDIVAQEIATYRTQLRRVTNRADFANVDVTLVTRGGGDNGEDGGAWTPGDAWHDALRVLEVIAGVAVIAAAIAVPLLVAWLLGWAARRGVTRRRRERALDMA